MRWNEIINESPRPSWLGIDNPGGEWLERAKEKCRQSPKGIRGNCTAYTRKPILILTEDLMNTEGFNGEHAFRTQSDKFKALQAEVDKTRFDNKNSPILVGVNVDGKPYIMEGNHRTAVAWMDGISAIWGTVQWYGGSEELDGEWSPASLHEKWKGASSRPIEEAFDTKAVTWAEFGSSNATFEFTVNDQDFKGCFATKGNNVWDFAFLSLPSGEQRVPSVGNTGIQGSSSLQVFGHVLSGMVEFIDRVAPAVLTFGADKGQGKAHLYLAMARKLKSRVSSMGYAIAYEEKYGATYFEVEKVN